jgi:hypothetical protein
MREALPVLQKGWVVPVNPPDLFPADTLFLVQPGKLADARDDPLTRTSDCPDRLYQGPIAIILTIHLLVVSAQIHVENII